MGSFVARQVLRPGSVFGPGKFAGGVAAVGNDAQLHSFGPADHVDGEGDDVEIASDAGSFIEPTAVAYDDYAQGGVQRLAGHRLIGFDEALEARFQPFRFGWEGNPYACGIAAHPLPVAIEGEHHAVVNPQGGENAPAREQSYLPWREAEVPRIADVVVMQQEAVHYSSF